MARASSSCPWACIRPTCWLGRCARSEHVDPGGSALPAWAAQFKDRVTLREGLAADIVIHDLDNLNLKPIEVAYDLPADEWRRIQKAEGYRHILVNGVETFQDDRCTGATPGGLLRSGRAAA